MNNSIKDPYIRNILKEILTSNISEMEDDIKRCSACKKSKPLEEFPSSSSSSSKCCNTCVDYRRRYNQKRKMKEHKYQKDSVTFAFAKSNLNIG